MKSCGRVRKLLSDYLEKELDQEIQKEIQEHIRFCTDCFEKEKTLRNVLSLSKELPESEPSPEFIYKFRQKLDRERFFVPAQKKVSLARKWVWALPVTAVALLVFILNMPQTKGPVEVAQEQPATLLPAQQPTNLAQQNEDSGESLSAVETPVEFVMDNWDRAALENLQRSGHWEGGSGVFMTSNQNRQVNPDDRPFRVYVMPVVQNQTTGYKTRQPY